MRLAANIRTTPTKVKIWAVLETGRRSTNRAVTGELAGGELAGVWGRIGSQHSRRRADAF
jgi:hypothetical protein